MILTTNQGDEFQISEADFHLFEGLRFSTHRAGRRKYVRCYRSTEWKKYFYAHRLVMSAAKGLEVDHINGDGMDNRRENLRLCDRSQNCANAKGRKGYHWGKGNGGYVVQITKNRKVHFIGTFKTESEAAAAYADAHVRLHGQFSSRSEESSMRAPREL